MLIEILLLLQVLIIISVKPSAAPEKDLENFTRPNPDKQNISKRKKSQEMLC